MKTRHGVDQHEGGSSTFSDHHPKAVVEFVGSPNAANQAPSSNEWVELSS
jgi:hypothetical protein